MKEVSNVSASVTTAPSAKSNFYYRDTELAKKFGVSRVTIWRWVASGTFPSPVKLSPGCTRWVGISVDNWEADRAA